VSFDPLPPVEAPAPDRARLLTAPATQRRSVRCNHFTAGGENGFCKKHIHRLVRTPDGQTIKRHGRPEGELPWDPALSQFCRALTSRWVRT
jgi:hypothetical protein